MKLYLYIYSSILFLFFIFSFAFIDQNFIYLRDLYTGLYPQHRLIVAVIYLLLILFSFLTYGLILRSAGKVRINKSHILLVMLLGLFSYPAILSYDIFNYIATAKVAFHYLENPYIVMPIEFIGDPLLNFTHAANKIALYGPFWILLSGVPYVLSFGNYLLSIILFKAVIISFFFGVIFLLKSISEDKFSFLFFALNPLVIIEIFISGHNDIVMMFFALLGFYLIKKERIVLAVMAFTLSVLIKYATIVLLPIVIYLVIKKIKKREIDWNKVWILSFAAMFIVFSLSFIREEIYPWYLVWPLTFLALIKGIEKIKLLFLFLSLGLMLRYIPYMLLGTHFGATPILKFFLMITPPLIYITYIYLVNAVKNK